MPKVSICDLISENKCCSVHESFVSPLPFKIPVTRTEFVEQYPEHFQLGLCEYKSNMDSWLDYLTTGQSEYTVVGIDSLWLVVMNACCAGVVFYRDEKDKSSKVRLRPDASMFIHGALFAKSEEKASTHDIGTATSELCSKFSPKARKLFPLGSDRIIGITAAKELIEIHLIIYNSATKRFESHPHRSYNLQFLGGRVSFAVDIVKYMRFVASITAPQEKFHLIPDVRKKTPNGHHVSWTNDGLRKEFHGLAAVQMERIQTVYAAAELPNVEKGTIEGDNCILVTRVGHTLAHAVHKNLIRRDDAIENIRAGINQLHGLGLAHCDICVRNVFVDIDVPHLAFLDDLEYLTPLEDEPPTVRNAPNPPPVTAYLLDEYQFAQFSREVMTM